MGWSSIPQVEPSAELRMGVVAWRMKSDVHALETGPVARSWLRAEGRSSPQPANAKTTADVDQPIGTSSAASASCVAIARRSLRREGTRTPTSDGGAGA